MALEPRRNGHSLFRRFLARVEEGAEGRDLSHLAGTSVSVWFGENMGDRPPRSADDRLIAPLLDALSAARVDHAASLALADKIAREGFPDQMPPGAVCTGTTPDGLAGFVANVVCMPEQARVAFGGRLFAVSLHMPTQISLFDAAEELRRRVREHDKPQIDQLLLTAGEPDRNGWRYPAEELVAASLVRESEIVLEADHIRGMWVHLWGAGTCLDLPVTRLAPLEG